MKKTIYNYIKRGHEICYILKRVLGACKLKSLCTTLYIPVIVVDVLRNAEDTQSEIQYYNKEIVRQPWPQRKLTIAATQDCKRPCVCVRECMAASSSMCTDAVIRHRIEFICSGCHNCSAGWQSYTDPGSIRASLRWCGGHQCYLGCSQPDQFCSGNWKRYTCLETKKDCWKQCEALDRNQSFLEFIYMLLPQNIQTTATKRIIDSVRIKKLCHMFRITGMSGSTQSFHLLQYNKVIELARNADQAVEK